MFARTLIYKEYLILISLHDSLFYSLTFQIHIHIHIFISEVTCYFCNFCYRLTILLPLKFFFTFLPLKFFFTFLPFYPFTFKLRPDVAPTAWRRNLFCVPTLPSLHRHAFSSSSPRIFIPLVSHFHPPGFTFPSYIFVTFSASLWWIVKKIPVCATTV